MDKNMLQGLDGLPEEDQRRMAAVIDQLQVRDSQSCAYVAFGRFGKNTPIPKLGILFMCEHLCMRMYNSVVERCFNDCVDNFTRKSLQKQEETCVMRCAEKFLKHSMRVGLRFAELNNLAATPDQSS